LRSDRRAASFKFDGSTAFFFAFGFFLLPVEEREMRLSLFLPAPEKKGSLALLDRMRVVSARKMYINTEIMRDARDVRVTWWFLH
jgi:hypothetical protein